MNVILEIVGLPSKTVEIEFLRLDEGVAVVKNECAENGESRFRLRDGRSLDNNNAPTAWNFWRLSVRDCRNLSAGLGIDNGGDCGYNER